MVRRSSVLLSGLLVSLVLVGCGDSSRVLLTADDSGSEVLVDTGDRFEVELESNPTTGFEWQYVPATGTGTDTGTGNDTGAEDVIELISSTYQEPDSDLVGAGGTEVFVFEAVGTGATIARLEYVRPFDEPPVAERIVEFIVRVDGAPWVRPTNTSPTATGSVPGPDGTAIRVGQMVESILNGTFTGFVVWDDGGARLCEALAESFPPQCGGRGVIITNPDLLMLQFEEAQEVRWTDGEVKVLGDFDGKQLTLVDQG